MLHVCYMTMIYTLGKGGEQFLHVLVPRNTFTDVFDNACDICDFRAHIFCPQTTQELPKKRDEAGSPEDNDLPTDALSQIDYGHIRHCEDCLYQRTTKRTFRKIWVGICVWLSRRWASPPPPSPTFQKAPPPQEWWAERFLKERASIGKRTTTTTTVTRAGKIIGFRSKKKKHYCTSITCTFCYYWLRQETGPNATFCGGRDRDTAMNFPFSFWTCLDRAHENLTSGKFAYIL